MRAMQWALDDAHVDPARIQYINAHGTSTQANDKMETLAIRHIFGAHAANLAVSSTKSMMGHALGGSGAIEAIVSALSLFERVLHPTINYHTPDPECDLDYVPNEARSVPDLNCLMSNSFGLGGQNASIVMARL